MMTRSALFCLILALAQLGGPAMAGPPQEEAPLPSLPESAPRPPVAATPKPQGAEDDAAGPAGRFPGLFFRGYRDDPAVSRMPETGGDPVKEEARYRECLARAGKDPDHALDLALRWSTEGGGLPAEHCLAVALITIGRPDAAADRLEDMLAKLRRGQGLPYDPLGGPASIDALAAAIYAQLGNAWLLADDPERALDAFTHALSILPSNVLDLEQQIYLDRARAQGILERFPEAIEDLDRAEAIDPEVADIYVLRASAERAIGAFDKARDDLARAKALRPDWPLLWLEEANLAAMEGRIAAARKIWTEIAARWPDSREAEAARHNLARLDAAGDAELRPTEALGTTPGGR